MTSPVAVPDSLSASVLRSLHPEAITSREEITKIIRDWLTHGTVLRRGTNELIQPELASLLSIQNGEIELECKKFGKIGTTLFLSTEFHGVPFFCSLSVRRVETLARSVQRVTTSIPGVVYRAERRDRTRQTNTRRWQSIELVRDDEHKYEGRIVDQSGDGLGIAVPIDVPIKQNDGFQITNPATGISAWAVVRNQRKDDSIVGWRRVGLSSLPIAPSPPLQSVPATKLLQDLGGPNSFGSARAISEEPKLVEFLSKENEPLVGYLDQVGDSNGAPAVLIPSAWGKTKETMVGLAATILSTFEKANRPISVLRFDGIRKRGESHNDPECKDPQLANLNYTFSQGAVDLLSAARYLQDEKSAGPIIVVSLSVASVEARRAIVLDDGQRFHGWISLVGATDPQSLIRIISGGIDYLAGAERGIKFGRQDVQGMLLDIDNTAADALGSKIAFLEDARRDFSKIECPVTWIAGSHDAWMDPRRIYDVLSFGPGRNRRLITSDTGHQLKDSQEAAQIFALIATECARQLGSATSVVPTLPDPKSLRKRQIAERKRLTGATKASDLRSFWRDYLIGRDQTLGMELVTETSSYRSLLDQQLAALDLSPGHLIVDLGSGLGTFERALERNALTPPGLKVLAVDYVVEGIKRGRSTQPTESKISVSYVVADLGLEKKQGFPLSPGTADRVIGSLVYNYLSDPHRFLCEALSLLRPGGLLVLSVLRKDADTSKICVDGVGELRTGQGLESFGENREKKISGSLGGFINDAARLLDLEEQGVFRFWDRDDLKNHLKRAGFVSVTTKNAFGSPPQAWLVSARTPE